MNPHDPIPSDPVEFIPPPSSEATLVAKYLGTDAARGGPFALLGVTPDTFEDRDVLLALRARLDQTLAHPQSRTPEADEVRLALHAAAAQLLDPRARENAMRDWGHTARPRPQGITQAPQSPPTPDPQPFQPQARPPQRQPAPTPAPPSPQRQAPSSNQLPPPHQAQSIASLQIQHDMVLAIAACGGWNDRALRRVISLAQTRGVPMPEITQAIQDFSPRPHAEAPPLHQTRHPHAPPLYTQPPHAYSHASQAPSAPAHANRSDPSRAPVPYAFTAKPRRVIPFPLILAGVAVVAGSLLILGSVALFTSQNAAPTTPTGPGTTQGTNAAGGDIPPGPPRDTDGQLFKWAGERPPGASQPASQPVGTTTDAARAARELQLAVQALTLDPEAALPRVERAIQECATAWPRMTASELATTVASVVELFYRTNEPEQIDTLLRAIIDPTSVGAPALQPRPATRPWTKERVLARAWTAGLLTRLGRERNLPYALLADIDRELQNLLDGPRPLNDPAFDAGLVDALQSLAPKLAQDPARTAPGVWDGWIQAAIAAAALQPTRATDVWISALDALLPLADKPGVQPLIEQLVTQIRWQGDARAQRWLMARFDSLDTQRDAIVAITRALTSKSSVPGIDITMALSPAATEADRRLLRQRYADALGVGVAKDADALTQLWTEHARLASERAAAAQTIIDRLVALSFAAIVNDAAWLRWRGSLLEASDTLTSADQTLQALLARDTSPLPTNASLRSDAPPQWAPRYIAAGAEIPTRLALISELGRSAVDLHPADAEIILNESLRGTPIQVRDAARTAVVVRASSPVMINAMLEALPTAPRVTSTGEIIASLSLSSGISLDNANWRIEARRLLVERLLALMADRGPMRVADDLVSALAYSYESRASLTPLPATSMSVTVLDSDDPGKDAERNIARVLTIWWAIATDLPRPRDFALTLPEIQSRRAARLAVASGSIQRFAAEQISLTEVMAYVVAAEQPSHAAEAARTLDELTQKIRAATHVASQCLDTELAMLRLWSLRFGDLDANTQSESELTPPTSEEPSP